jgi:hypothetical protein
LRSRDQTPIGAQYNDRRRRRGAYFGSAFRVITHALAKQDLCTYSRRLVEIGLRTKDR